VRVGIVLDGGYFGGDTGFIALKIDDAVGLLGAAPAEIRDEIKPSLLRPPERFLPSTSDFSGRSLVISSRVTLVVNRRVGVVGLYFFIGMVNVLR